MVRYFVVLAVILFFAFKPAVGQTPWVPYQPTQNCPAGRCVNCVYVSGTCPQTCPVVTTIQSPTVVVHPTPVAYQERYYRDNHGTLYRVLEPITVPVQVQSVSYPARPVASSAAGCPGGVCPLK